MLAFEDPRFGELVLYAPPLNFFCILMIPCAFVPKSLNDEMTKVSNYFSIIIYWIENIFFVGTLLGFELILYPFMYLRSFINIIQMTSNFKRKDIAKKVIQFIFTGWAICIYLVFRDVFSYLKILWNDNGFKENYEVVNHEELNRHHDIELRVFNEIRLVSIEMFIKIKH